MSGDVQPRKRKDKKRKKDDEDTVKEIPAPKVTAGAAQAATQPGDVQMHVHNDHGTGGHWCAKIIFFILLVGLGALIGLIVLENRDLSNADTPLSESRYAEYFEGWVDENREDDHHHEEILEALNQLDDHGEDDDDQAHADDDHDDEGLDEEEEDADDGAPYAEEEDHDDERDLEDDEDEGDLPKLDDDEVEEIVATEKKVAEQEAQAEADNDDDGDDDEDNADDNDDDSQADDDDDVDVDDDDKDDAAGPTTVDAQSDDDNGDDDDTNGEDEPKVTQSGTGDDDDEDDQVVDDDDYNDDDQDNDNIGDQNDDDGDDEHENNVGEVEDDRNENYKQVNDDDGEFVDDGDEPVFGSKQTTEDDNDDDDDDEPENLVADDDDDNDADAIAKEIDQLADDDEGKTPFDEEKRTNALNEQINNLRADVEGEQKTEDSVDIRNETIHVKPNRLQESVTNGLPVEPVITAEVLKAQMDDLLDNYNKLADMMNFPKEKHSERETAKDDDDPLNDEPSYSTANVDNNDDDDDNEDDDFENFVDNDGGEEKYLAKLRREQEERNQQQQQKQQEKDESREQSSQIPSRQSESQIYEEELNRAKRHLDELKDPKRALEGFEAILRKQRRLAPALFGKARALDALAERQQSNVLLGEAIEAYRDVILFGDSVDDETFKQAAERCIDRSRFRGQYLKVLDVHQELIRRFDSEPKYRNQLAVTYLLANRMAEAKAVLHETLMRWIDDGVALVHYGFVLKNHDKNMIEAVQYLREGIATGHEGTQDGRFYFHLGDALQRLGRQKEALEVYQEGAEKKLFLSLYQRSLYNVDNLKSRPFWSIEQTTYSNQLELIRSQWTAIRDEGLKLLNAAGNFKDEAENLRDTGDWKQFELFFRGQRIDKNCVKAPLTCRLVEQFTAARSCKRGQVKFSVMHPGTHVWPHCGPTNCRTRAHLGLKVPSGTSIRVADQVRSWENGKWLIFDDSFEHEVWHNGTTSRLVLIVDFWHPGLTEFQRKSLSPI